MFGRAYPELHAHSCFSFLDGASQPEELAERAAALGYETVALTDHDGLSGSLTFAHAAREVGLRAVTGAEITLAGGAHLTLLVETAAGYRNLCRLITAAHVGDRRAPTATLDQVARHAGGLHCLSGCARHGVLARPVSEGRLREAEQLAVRLRAMFGRHRFSVELQRPYARGDARRNRLLTELAERLRVRTVATGDPHAHTRRRALLHQNEKLICADNDNACRVYDLATDPGEKAPYVHGSAYVDMKARYDAAAETIKEVAPYACGADCLNAAYRTKKDGAQ